MLLACNGDQITEQNGAVMSEVKTSGPVQVEDVDIYRFAIYTETDTIEYCKIGLDTLVAKPTILFLQGSLPAPLVFDMGSFKHINIPFDFKEIIDKYNLIEISMPNTPIIVGEDHLNRQYSYVTDTAVEYSFTKQYLKNNYLENYVNRANAVISDILRRDWALKDELHIIGHSQGAKVATVVASQNMKVTSVSLLGFNAFGRFDQYIRQERHNLKSGQITGEEYKDNIETHYKRWKDINQNPHDYENGHNAWTSFSIDYTQYLLQIDIPIYIGYGTEDLIAENCDLLPLKFIKKGKTNLTVVPYIGLNHNFFELANGVPDRRTGAHFLDVIEDIIAWTKSCM
ncbi:MAG: hypothetical protein COB85_06885 [Bacteroidetes bacterium]|nr:MAG: hypothetical protein COB85_06885 [Bacteroidota bacterium]